jgi:hypothetical protein
MLHEVMSATEVLLSEDGRIFRRNIAQTEVMVDEAAVFTAFREGQSVQVRNALLVGGETASLGLKSLPDGRVSIAATIPLKFIHLNTNFKLEGGVAMPIFTTPDPNEPTLNVDWDVRVACSGKVKLWFLVNTIQRHDGLFYNGECYLAASSVTNRIYRIPLANIYDEGRICMGVYTAINPSLQEALSMALTQFLASPWNSDLHRPAEKSDAFFRFKVSNDGYETLPVVGQWSNLCERISVPQLDALILPAPEGGAE